MFPPQHQSSHPASSMGTCPTCGCVVPGMTGPGGPSQDGPSDNGLAGKPSPGGDLITAIMAHQKSQAPNVQPFV